MFVCKTPRLLLKAALVREPAFFEKMQIVSSNVTILNISTILCNVVTLLTYDTLGIFCLQYRQTDAEEHICRNYATLHIHWTFRSTFWTLTHKADRCVGQVWCQASTSGCLSTWLWARFDATVYKLACRSCGLVYHSIPQLAQLGCCLCGPSLSLVQLAQLWFDLSDPSLSLGLIIFWFLWS